MAVKRQARQVDYLKVEDVQKLLDVSKSKAYQIIRNLNRELAKKGIIVIAGRIHRRYLEERCFY